MSNLKPCPFCGGKVKSKLATHNGVTLMFFNCENAKCGAVVSFNNPLSNYYPKHTDVFYNARAKPNDDLDIEHLESYIKNNPF